MIGSDEIALGIVIIGIAMMAFGIRGLLNNRNNKNRLTIK